MRDNLKTELVFNCSIEGKCLIEDGPFTLSKQWIKNYFAVM